MITRDQFEAHVRAEAAKEFPLVNQEGPIDFSINDRQRDNRTIVITARMEHEWPLVEALHGLCYGPMSIDAAADVAMDALSPYTTKPIEP